MGIITAQVVHNGKEACEAVEADRFDVIFMDISMPVMTGLEATRMIRRIEAIENRRPAKIVALTGNAFDTDRQNCFLAGMNEFLTKPIRKDQLIQCLRQLSSAGR